MDHSIKSSIDATDAIDAVDVISDAFNYSITSADPLGPF